MTYRNNLNYKVFAPLHNFNWSGNKFSINNFCSIEKFNKPPVNLSQDEAFLSKEETSELFEASHWIFFEQSPTEELLPSEKINIFLLALWIIIPTKVQVCYRFEGSPESDNNTQVHLLDRFLYIETQVKDKINDKNLEELQGLINTLKSIYITKKRLWNSLLLTFHGCCSKEWQVVFICFSAAIEGILTYKKGYGITERLARSFACLTEKGEEQRDSAFRNFKHSYEIRSDIMHGRITNSKMNSDDKLNKLAEFSDLLRTLWKTILLSKSILSELEKDDKGREAFFRAIKQL